MRAFFLRMVLLAAAAPWLSYGQQYEGAQLDVILVVDTSASIGDDNFKKMVTRLLDLPNTFPMGETKTRIGIVEFNSVARSPVNLNNKMTGDENEYRVGIKSLRMGGFTATHEALKLALADMIGWNQDRGRPSLVLILTDGCTDVPPGSDKTDDEAKAEAEKYAKALLDRDTLVYLVIIGTEKDKCVDHQLNLVGNKTQNRIALDNFDALTKDVLDKIRKATTNQFCKYDPLCTYDQGKAICNGRFQQRQQAEDEEPCIELAHKTMPVCQKSDCEANCTGFFLKDDPKCERCKEMCEACKQCLLKPTTSTTTSTSTTTTTSSKPNAIKEEKVKEDDSKSSATIIFVAVGVGVLLLILFLLVLVALVIRRQRRQKRKRLAVIKLKNESEASQMSARSQLDRSAMDGSKTAASMSNVTTRGATDISSKPGTTLTGAPIRMRPSEVTSTPGSADAAFTANQASTGTGDPKHAAMGVSMRSTKMAPSMAKTTKSAKTARPPSRTVSASEGRRKSESKPPPPSKKSRGSVSKASKSRGSVSKEKAANRTGGGRGGGSVSKKKPFGGVSRFASEDGVDVKKKKLADVRSRAIAGEIKQSRTVADVRK